MASDKPLKGILKNAVHGETPAQTRQDPREIAVQHARILQQRKDLELQILQSVEFLSHLPLQRGPQHSSTHPAPSDVTEFKAHVRLFQPGDYDDLIEERSANRRCGYALCPNPKPKPSPGGQWKLVGVGRPSFHIVDRKESDRWCSELCKKRALYVKVQLNETAAWERIGVPDINIDLYEEDHASKDEKGEDLATSAASDLSRLKLDDDTRSKEQAAVLARERGDVGDATSRMVELTIQERNVEPLDEDEAKTANAPAETRDTSLSVEGYTPGTVKAHRETENIKAV